MADGNNSTARRSRGRRWQWLAVFALLFIAFAVSVLVALYRADPILRSSVIQTLSARFKSKVELDGFHVSLFKGLQVSGEGLRIFGDTDPNNHEPGVQPIIAVGKFHFGLKIADFLRSPMRVDTVYVNGLRLNLPPRQDRSQMQRMGTESGRIRIVVDTFIFDDTQLIINTLRPGKLPIEFDIASLKMTRTGTNSPLRFEASLTNPKPVGEIYSTGYFGPWRADSPRETPLQGNYSFTHADLSTIKGLSGTLSSSGQYAGSLGRIVVDGETDTPDFRLAVCRRAVPLHTNFHAIVDGTSGDTYLQPVRARILNSWLLAKGSVVRQKYLPGHRVTLDVRVDGGRIDDLLKLAVRTDPPLLTGAVNLRTTFELSPGEEAIADRIKLAGNFQVSDADFSNETVQSKIEALSLRSRLRKRGRSTSNSATDAETASVRSSLGGTFDLEDGMITFPKIQFSVPGTVVALNGKYSMDGSKLDFHGTARMDAKLSQMLTGWKALLLKPVDPFFSKNGAGTEVPVQVTGTRAEPHIGLDFGHKDKNDTKSAAVAPMAR
jgi:hypothetical protein